MLRNVGIGSKVTVGFLSVAVLALAVGLLGSGALYTIQLAGTRLYEETSVPLAILIDAAAVHDGSWDALRDAIYRSAPAEIEVRLARLDALRAEGHRLAAQLGQRLGSDEERAAFADVERASQELERLLGPLRPLVAQNRDTEAFAFTGPGSPAAKAFEAQKVALKRLTTLKTENARVTSEANARLAARTRWAMNGVVLIAFALAAVLAVWLRTLLRPLRSAAEKVRQIADGDLRVSFDVTGRSDEIGILSSSFEKMLGRLREIVSTLKTSASELGTVARELAEQTRAQSALVERQASGVAQTSVSTRELQQTANVAASRAASVLDVAKRAAEMSESGHVAAERSMDGMRQIQGAVEGIVSQSGRMLEQARQVGDIVETVRDLAAQSHVLSLNASIEASRAGEAGKSFAVVAAEVRALAEQSGAGAARIGKIVQDMLAAVGATMETTERGSRGVEGSAAQVRASGESLQQIGGIVRETSDAALQIASAVQQQSTGIEQIAQAMQDLDKGMDEAVSRIQVLERSATELATTADRISAIAGEFRI